MVYLTMTSTIVEALEKIQSLERSADDKSRLQIQKDGARARFEGESALEKSLTIEERTGNAQSIEGRSVAVDAAADTNEQSKEPSLSNPKLGNPISHGQVIDLLSQVKAKGLSPRSLDVLLRGARVYVAPPPPKPEPVSATYSALLQTGIVR